MDDNDSGPFWKPYTQGFNARVANRPHTENPYKSGTHESRQWIAGWEDAAAFVSQPPTDEMKGNQP